MKRYLIIRYYQRRLQDDSEVKDLFLAFSGLSDGR